MSIKHKVLAAAATLTIVGGVSAAAGPMRSILSPLARMAMPASRWPVAGSISVAPR